MKFMKKVLDNGLTVLFEKRDVPVTTVMLGVRYGSAYESSDEKGMAHFIEHMCFKGTEKRTVKQIAENVEKVGGDLNAFTSEEFTVYHVKLPSAHLNVAMDVIFDIFFNASFPESDVKKEANVICEEIKMNRDNPIACVINEIKRSLYEEPFGDFITGTQEGVRGMNREMLFKKHREVYAPKNSILCVVGNNDFDEIVSLAESMSVEREGNVPKMPKIVKRNEKILEKRDGIEQTNLAIGFHFPYASDDGHYVAEVFSTILGRGMSSKLFGEVRQKRGLVYGVKTYLDLGKDYGYMIIWAGTDSEKEKEVIDICLREFRKMGDISEEELDVAKIQVIGNREVESEGSGERAADLIFAEISGKAENYYDFERKINKVSLDDIKKLASESEYALFSLSPQ